MKLEINLEEMSGPEKGIQAQRPVGTEPEDSKVRKHQDNFLVGQKTKGGLLRLDKVRREPNVALSHLHTSALSLRKSDELIRHVLKVSSAE